MALLTPVKVGPNAALLDVLGGLVAATAGGDSFYLTGRESLVVNNASAGAVTVTISTVVANAPDSYGIVNAAHDLVAVVAAGKLCVFSPLQVGRFRDANGNAQVTYSAVVTVTVGVLAWA